MPLAPRALCFLVPRLPGWVGSADNPRRKTYWILLATGPAHWPLCAAPNFVWSQGFEEMCLQFQCGFQEHCAFLFLILGSCTIWFQCSKPIQTLTTMTLITITLENPFHNSLSQPLTSRICSHNPCLSQQTTLTLTTKNSHKHVCFWNKLNMFLWSLLWEGWEYTGQSCGDLAHI